MLSYDSEIGIGYWIFKLSTRHPFFLAARVHDAWYDDLIAKTCPKTLAQIDKEFYNNMLRAAWRLGWQQKDPVTAIRYTVMARRFYKIARWWAVYIRPELEAYRPERDRVFEAKQ